MTARVAYVAGGWATNVGNAFYQLGNLHLLEQSFGRDNVAFVPDLNFWIWKVRDHSHYDLAPRIAADLYVFSGPILTDALLLYEDMFDEISARGARIGFLSAGAQRYTDEEAAVVARFLEGYGDTIDFVATRDRHTYEAHANRTYDVFDGICASMFVGDAVTVPDVADDPYVVFNFSADTEPSIQLTADGEVSIRKLGRLRRPQRDLRGMRIVRTRSEQFVRDPDVAFDRPNMFTSDLPFGYLAIYRSARYVFSERVHTCAATLAMGGTAMYLLSSARAAEGRRHLLARIGAHGIEQRPVALDMGDLMVLKREQQDFVSSVAARS